jgi:serine/threonine protein kinase
LDHGAPHPRLVCVKLVHGTLDEAQARSLREEMRLLSRVRHANVVTMLDAGEEDGRPFLVLELIDGSDLRAVSQALRDEPAGPAYPRIRLPSERRRLPERTAVHVACAILRALAAVDRVLPGLVHRDVTPHNVLVSLDGEVKLADFGIALARDRARWTGSKIVKGKFGYMAPEQIRGAELDGRVDVFAVGVILYELLSGLRPASPLGGMEELRAIERGELVPLGERPGALPRALTEIVDRLLEPDRERRVRSADDALRLLAPFGDGDLGSLRLASILRTMADGEAAERRNATTAGD